MLRELPWEQEQAEWNKRMGGYDTELWKCAPELECVSSTAVRAALDKGEDPSAILPAGVKEYIDGLAER